jgi:hypothetical protein
MKQNINSKFYTFIQNNSGGSFNIEEEKGICKFVIIEALSSSDANSRAQRIGLYFDGCVIGLDCPCCGDRWSEVYESDGKEFPMIYNKTVNDIEKSAFMENCFIHYLDGTFKKIELK